MSSGNIDRRIFFKDTGKSAALAATVHLATSVASVRAAGANERIRVGVIGCGGQGKGAHVGGLTSMDEAEVVYVCDPDEKRRGEAAEATNGAKAVGDLRRILDDPSIDAVTVATPDHWHTPAALLAMEAGKHVYVEKPCSHNLREGRLLEATAARTGKIVQHGTQSRSNSGIHRGGPDAARWHHR